MIYQSSKLAAVVAALLASSALATITYSSSTVQEYEAGSGSYCSDEDYEYTYAEVIATDSFEGDIDVCERVFKYDDGDLTLCCTSSDRESYITGCEPFYATYSDEGIYPSACGDDDSAACTGVESDSVAKYLIVYTAMDSSENSAGSLHITVKFEDTTAPEIDLTDEDSYVFTVEKCDSFDEPDVAAVDCVDGETDVTSSIVYFEMDAETVVYGTNDDTQSLTTGVYCTGGETVDELDVDTVGVYCITYSSSDSEGNEATTETIVVYVEDTTGPEVEFDTSSETIECAAYTALPDPGAYATDEPCSDYYEATTTYDDDDVNTCLSTVGTYSIPYEASDGYNTGTSNFKLTVEDTTAPVITCPNDVEMYVDDSYTVEDATATDDCSTSITISSSGDVDTTTTGVYDVEWTATDESGNYDTCTQSVDVVDETTPIITLVGDEYYYVEACTGSYSEYGASAFDNYADDVTVDVGGDTVDIWTVGTYTVTYDACDSSNNCADTVYRYVIVEDTTDPTLYMEGGDIVLMEAGVYRRKAHAYAIDTCPPYHLYPCVNCEKHSDDDDCSDNCVSFTAEVVPYDEFFDGTITSEYWVSVYGNDADEYVYYCGSDYDTAVSNMESAVSALNLTYFSQACAEYEITYTVTDSNGNEATGTQMIWTTDTISPEVESLVVTTDAVYSAKVITPFFAIMGLVVVGAFVVPRVIRRRAYNFIPPV